MHIYTYMHVYLYTYLLSIYLSIYLYIYIYIYKYYSFLAKVFPFHIESWPKCQIPIQDPKLTVYTL